MKLFDPKIFDPKIFDTGSTYTFMEWDVKNIVAATSTYIPEIGNRFYIGSFPDTLNYPAVVLYSISRIKEIPEADVMTERFQFSCYADSLSSATDIADAIKDKIKRYCGETPSKSFIINNSWFDNMNYLYESEISKHVKILDMQIQYRGI